MSLVQILGPWLILGAGSIFGLCLALAFMISSKTEDEQKGWKLGFLIILLFFLSIVLSILISQF